MTSLPHKILQEQVALGVTLMVLEGALEGDSDSLFKKPHFQPSTKEPISMPFTLGLTSDLPAGSTDSDILRDCFSSEYCVIV